MIYLRRTTEHGTVQLLGHTFTVDPLWPIAWYEERHGQPVLEALERLRVA
jgi:hypothetical protein